MNFVALAKPFSLCKASFYRQLRESRNIGLKSRFCDIYVTLLKENLQISKSDDWNFYSLHGYEIPKYFSCKFFNKLLNLFFFEN